jgi:hypothetical protein
MIHGTPELYFMHFCASGPPDTSPTGCARRWIWCTSKRSNRQSLIPDPESLIANL